MELVALCGSRSLALVVTGAWGFSTGKGLILWGYGLASVEGGRMGFVVVGLYSCWEGLELDVCGLVLVGSWRLGFVVVGACAMWLEDQTGLLSIVTGYYSPGQDARI